MHATMIRRVSVHVRKNIANQHTPCSSTLLGKLGPASHRPGTWDATAAILARNAGHLQWDLLFGSSSQTARLTIEVPRCEQRIGEDHRDPVRRARLLLYRKLREAVALCTKRAKSCSDGGGKHPPNRFEHPQHSSTIGPEDIISIIHWGCVQNILPTFTNQQLPTRTNPCPDGRVSPPYWRSLRRLVNRTL